MRSHMRRGACKKQRSRKRHGEGSTVDLILSLFLPCSSPLKQLFSHTHARTHKLSIHTLVHTHASIVSLQGSTSILSKHEYLIGLPSQFTQFIMLYWAVSGNQYASFHQSYVTICASARVVMQHHWVW